jgi:hypothetical protein
MSESRRTIKRRSLKIKKSGAHPSDVPLTNLAPAEAFPNPHLSIVGKEGEDVKRDLANLSRFKNALGTDDREAGIFLLAQAVLAKPHLGVSGNLEEYVASVTAILRSIGPRDDLEGVLAVQMAAVHNLAMEFMSQASRSDRSLEVVDANVNRANKLLRTFTALMEALNRHRGKVTQPMMVGNVNIADGGQAIVGSVNHSGPGKASKEDEEKKLG